MSVVWKIEQLERQTNTGGVVVAHWRATAQDEGYAATVYGSVGFTPDPTASNFVPYEDLTESNILTWVWGQVDKTETEASLAAQIETQKTPSVVSGLPWVSQVSVTNE